MSWEVKKGVSCPVELALEPISGRWKVMIIYHLFEGEQRFNQLNRLLVGITPRTLTSQLKELMEDGLVSRKVYDQIPPKVGYNLTELGRSLAPVLKALHDWGVEHGQNVPSK